MPPPVIPPVTTLPQAPLPTDPRKVFNQKAYPFVGALGAFGASINALAAAINAFGQYISPTTPATLPLSGTETLTITQGGNQRIATVADLGAGGGGGGGTSYGDNILLKYGTDPAKIEVNAGGVITGKGGIIGMTGPSDLTIYQAAREENDFVGGDWIAVDVVAPTPSGTDPIYFDFFYDTDIPGQYVRAESFVPEKAVRGTMYVQLPDDGVSPTSDIKISFGQNLSYFPFVVIRIYKL